MQASEERATVVSWDVGTSWYAGPGALEVALPGRLTGRVRTVVDETMADRAAGRVLLDRLERLGASAGATQTQWRHPAGATTVDRVDEAAAAWAADPADVYVLVGGGSTIDFGLLALLPPDWRAALRSGGRSGFVMLPQAAPLGRPVTVAVPTTLGTGAEISRVACVERDGKRLVHGGGLQADVAVCDAGATAGLPYGLVLEAVVEVAARLVVPFSAPRQDNVHPLAHALGDDVLLADLTGLMRVAGRLEATGTADADTRLALAAISAHSHGGWAHVGRDAFSSPLWFVATELSHALVISKSQATAMLLPSWAAAVRAGRRGLGDAERLAALEAHMAFQDPRGVGVVDRVSDLLPAPAGLPGPHEARRAVAHQVTAACIRRWGAGLPMLAGVTSADVRTLVEDALDRATRPREILCST